MPKTLLERIGPDTLAKLEEAATRRYAAAVKLTGDEPLSALYLFGYAIEMRLKAAYYRLAALAERWNISQPLPGNPDSPRAIAEREIKRLRPLWGLPPRSVVGHDLGGWAILVIETRAHHTLGGLDGELRDEFWGHVQRAEMHWSQILRYRPNKPYDYELEYVAAAAGWMKQNYRGLWS